MLCIGMIDKHCALADAMPMRQRERFDGQSGLPTRHTTSGVPAAPGHCAGTRGIRQRIRAQCAPYRILNRPVHGEIITVTTRRQAVTACGSHQVAVSASAAPLYCSRGPCRVCRLCAVPLHSCDHRVRRAPVGSARARLRRTARAVCRSARHQRGTGGLASADGLRAGAGHRDARRIRGRWRRGCALDAVVPTLGRPGAVTGDGGEFRW